MPKISTTLASTIVTNARAYLNEATASFWSDAELLVWVNNAIIDVVTRSRCIETTENVTLVAAQAEYAITASYIGITGAFYNDGTTIKGLQRRAIKDIGTEEYSTVPIYWYEWNGKIGIYPVATAATAGKIVTVYLISRPTAVIASGTIPTPACYDRLLTIFVAAQGYKKDSQFDKATALMAEYIESIDRFRVDYLQKPKEIEDVS